LKKDDLKDRTFKFSISINGLVDLLPKRKTTILFLILIIPVFVSAQENLLNAGPMPGYSEMKEASIWLQTKEEVTVFAKYWDVNNPDNAHLTNVIKTCKCKAFTAVLIADTVEPGNQYRYDLYIDNQKIEFKYETRFQTQALWKWRGNPPDFSFLMGSGAYINETIYDRPGKPYGGDYEIYHSMANTKADFMIWLGDNLYLREPDWNSWAGIIHRYTHDRSLPEMQEFLASTHHYAIWDDHDYGPNDSDRSFWNKNKTREAFRLFWANPSYGVGNIEGAISFFQWGDADFYLLDNRTYRTPNNLQADNKTQLGDEQLQWLFDNLVSTYSTFKFVVMGGVFLSTSGVYESYTNYGFEKERQKIIDFIYENDIKNVIFLTGDVHFSEVSVLRKEGNPTIWDITSSPLNSGVNIYGQDQNNTLRIPESVIMERNFAEVALSGARNERKVKITYFNKKGEKIWDYEFGAENRPKQH